MKLVYCLYFLTSSISHGVGYAILFYVCLLILLLFEALECVCYVKGVRFCTS